MITKNEVAKKGLIQLAFRPSWSFVTCTRVFVQDFFKLSIPDNMKTYKIALAVSELLENAIKFARDKDSIITLNINPKKESIQVEVENPAKTADIEELKRIFATFHKGNSLENFLENIKLAADRKDGKSQLGLARIRYELQEKLTLSLDGENVKVTINIK